MAESLAHLTKLVGMLVERGEGAPLLLMVSMIVANSKEKKWETGGRRRAERRGFGITTEKDFAALGYFADV